ncbi:MAG: hypothetical protein V7L05_24865 [Nostoc sp.]|uniref:hypothetical protein n=1 Tax=Nostoc sp. TaxID=1180 RepID=UPI002FF56E26
MTNNRILDFKFWILVKQRGEPVRWAALPSCSRSVSPWEKRLAFALGVPEASPVRVLEVFPHERLHQPVPFPTGRQGRTGSCYAQRLPLGEGIEDSKPFG